MRSGRTPQGDQFSTKLDGQETNNRGIAGESILCRAEKLKNLFGFERTFYGLYNDDLVREAIS